MKEWYINREKRKNLFSGIVNVNRAKQSERKKTEHVNLRKMKKHTGIAKKKKGLTSYIFNVIPVNRLRRGRIAGLAHRS